MITGSVALAATNLVKKFTGAAKELTVLDGLTFEVERGQLAAITGPSGSGKTTLLYLLAGLDRPTSGEVRFEGQRLDQFSPDELARHRNTRIGLCGSLQPALRFHRPRERNAASAGPRHEQR
jgi:putative ABC transport system ATP-binding protein